ncbi:polysaccharide biosynthesis/export family protein [bacterium]|nr:polysaccharide biosynthesis/export family protein [bacterium]
MRYAKPALVIAAVAGVLLLNRYEHQQTRRRIDELAASMKHEAPAPIQVPPAGAVPLELSHVTLPPYVIDPPDVLLVQVLIRDSKKNTTTPLPVQDVSGQFVVRPDGTVGLGYWGSVSVGGLTIDQAASAIRAHLTKRDGWPTGAEPPVVVLDVLAFNSKRYYVISTNAEGTQVHAFPQTGHETVLDAIAAVNGLPAGAANGTITVRRRTATGEQSLPVDWAAITQHGVTATNYQLLTGDRVVVTLGR